MKRKVVVVDGYSGGNAVVLELLEKEIEIYHVQSSSKIWDKVNSLGFDYSKFVANYSLDNYVIDEIVLILRNLNIDYVIAGTETGVEIADEISFKLNIKSNGILESDARRNKFKMIEKCREYGLKVPKVLKTSSLNEVLNWFEDNNFKKIVLKPISSAGTENVAFCDSFDSIRVGFFNILGKKNIFGEKNQEVLASEYMEGTEYFVNTVSSNGNVFVTDIWKYEKRSINGACAVYDRNILCPFDGSVEKKIIEYVRNVIAAMNIKWGPAHTEVMLTENGPMLVEIGARPDGLTMPEVNRKAIGVSPVELIDQCYLETISVLNAPKNITMYAQTVYLTAYQDGILTKLTGIEKVKKLSSFFQISLRAVVGNEVVKTVNYFTALGFVTLISADPKLIEHDYKIIREMENKNEMFEIR